jgi:N-acetylmannosamine-6-phosphate 2-epimerase/N-acetylmannosamine kinase
VNPEVLDLPAAFQLVKRLDALLGVPCTALNDAQAAAWGEHVHGAGAGRDLVFMTISSGIGGGIVAGGQLLQGRGGLAGHIGQTGANGQPSLEQRASGFALARAAQAQGRRPDTRALLTAAASGEAWATAIRAQALDDIADALVDLQRLLDPPCIVIGGGIGLAPGILDGLRDRLDVRPALMRPTLVAAQLGHDAGLVGAADLAGRLSVTPGA